MAGENCSPNCATRDHATWGECQRAKNVKVAYCASHKGADYSAQKRWDKELNDYAGLKAAGINPEGTTRAMINKAYEDGGT
jgi:hypothetical protein